MPSYQLSLQRPCPQCTPQLRLQRPRLKPMLQLRLQRQHLQCAHASAAPAALMPRPAWLARSLACVGGGDAWGAARRAARAPEADHGLLRPWWGQEPLEQQSPACQGPMHRSHARWGCCRPTQPGRPPAGQRPAAGLAGTDQAGSRAAAAAAAAAGCEPIPAAAVGHATAGPRPPGPLAHAPARALAGAAAAPAAVAATAALPAADGLLLPEGRALPRELCLRRHRGQQGRGQQGIIVGWWETKGCAHCPWHKGWSRCSDQKKEGADGAQAMAAGKGDIKEGGGDGVRAMAAG